MKDDIRIVKQVISSRNNEIAILKKRIAILEVEKNKLLLFIEKNIKNKKGEIKMNDYEKNLDIVLNEIKNVLVSKHHDYGSKNLLRHGLKGIIVRVDDKTSRVDNLISFNKEEMVKSETIIDTFIDIAGYAIQACMIIKGYIK